MILYHGTDINGYEEILKAGVVKPVKRHFFNFPYKMEDGIHYLVNGESFNPDEIGNPFFLTSQKWHAMRYGNVVLSIHSDKIKKIKLFENRPFGNDLDEFYTFNQIPLDDFRVKIYKQRTFLIWSKIFYDKEIKHSEFSNGKKITQGR